MNGPAPGWEARADSFAPMAGSELVLLLGGNTGDPPGELALAEEHISAHIGRVSARSRDHWTEPWGFSDPRAFLNRALIVETAMSPTDVLNGCLAIEQVLGRVRAADGKPASRNIDIDILLIGDKVIERKGLVVPHPRLHLRRFALAPLVDLLPLWHHPKCGVTALHLLNALPA